MNQVFAFYGSTIEATLVDDVDDNNLDGGYFKIPLKQWGNLFTDKNESRGRFRGFLYICYWVNKYIVPL